MMYLFAIYAIIMGVVATRLFMKEWHVYDPNIGQILWYGLIGMLMGWSFPPMYVLYKVCILKPSDFRRKPTSMIKR